MPGELAGEVRLRHHEAWLLDVVTADASIPRRVHTVVEQRVALPKIRGVELHCLGDAGAEGLGLV